MQLPVVAEFERSMVRERTKAGMDTARARGPISGQRLAATCALHGSWALVPRGGGRSEDWPTGRPGLWGQGVWAPSVSLQDRHTIQAELIGQGANDPRAALIDGTPNGNDVRHSRAEPPIRPAA